MSKIFDCLVVGTGGVGSAAMYYAARRGWHTVGLDRFPVAHDRGSSHGHTRIIRQAYFEHPNYVPLLVDAYQLWDELESVSGKQLFQKTGLLQVGKTDGPIISGIRRSALEHRLSVREMTATEIRQEYPAFVVEDDDIGLFETNAGFLYVENCVQTFADEAVKLGAELEHDIVVRNLSREPSGFLVTTDKQTFRARRVIVAAGGWTGDLLPNFAQHLRTVAKHQHWFRSQDTRLQLDADCPTYFFETDSGYFYGFPGLSGVGVKIAEHSGGQVMKDPLTHDRNLCPTDLERVRRFLDSRFDHKEFVHHGHSLCFYTVSPDEHFIVDSTQPGLAVACGLSGHGFKFAPVLGKALVELTDGNRRTDMDFLRANRFNTATSQ